jgi:Flp pilus assembly CpaF family ATPase
LAGEMVMTTALEIEIHFVTSQTVLASPASVTAAAVAVVVVACGGLGIGKTTTKRRLFIAQ